MEMKKAIELAIEALTKERQRVAFDANTVRTYGSGSPMMEKRLQCHIELGEAILVFEAEIKNRKVRQDHLPGFRWLNEPSTSA